MGWRDASWVAGVDEVTDDDGKVTRVAAVDIPLRLKAVLILVCLRTNDRTHQTFCGQRSLAVALGASEEKVRAALSELESLGLITRTARHGNRGYRTSDLITVNTSWREGNLTGEKPTGESSRQENSGSPTQNLGKPTPETLGAEEIIQKDHSEGHSDPVPPNGFDAFYAIWPQKKKRPDALKAWQAALKRASPEHILERAQAYASNPHRRPLQYVPYPATWLRADGWDDNLDGPPEADTSTPLKAWEKPVGRPMTRAEERAHYLQEVS